MFASLAVLVAAVLTIHPVRVVGASMRPALDDGDLLLAVPLWLSSVGRYDLVVVEEPDTRAAVVKRVVGLPGEELQLLDDDLIVDGARPPRAITGVEDLTPLADVRGEALANLLSLPVAGFRLEAGRWFLPAGGRGVAGLRQPPQDGFLLAGGSFPGSKAVQDLGVEVEFSLDSGAAALELAIQEQGEEFVVRIEDGGRTATLVRVTYTRTGSDRTRMATRTLPDAVSHGRLFLTNTDLHLTVALNGELLFREPYGAVAPRDIQGLPPDLNFVRCSVGGNGPLGIQRVRLGRDWVWIAAGTHGGAAGFHLSRDEYFVLGDDPHQSRDSRQYAAVSRERVRGKVVGRLWPPGPVGSGWDR